MQLHVAVARRGGKLEEGNPRFPGAPPVASYKELPLSLAGGLHLPWSDVRVREGGSGDPVHAGKTKEGSPWI